MIPCKHEEQREEYLFGWMEEQEETRFLQHLQHCKHCQKAVKEHEAHSALLAPPPIAFEEVNPTEHQQLLHVAFAQEQEDTGSDDFRGFRSHWQRWRRNLQAWWALPIMVTACLWLVLRPAHISHKTAPHKHATMAKTSQPKKAVRTLQKQPRLRPVKALVTRKKTPPAFAFGMKQSFDFTAEETNRTGSSPGTTVDFSDDALAVTATPPRAGKPRVQLQEKSMNLAPMHDEGAFLAVAHKKPAKKSVQTTNHSLKFSTVASIHSVAYNREPRELSQHRVPLLQKIPPTEHHRLQTSVPALPAETRGSLSIWIPGHGQSRRQMRRL